MRVAEVTFKLLKFTDYSSYPHPQLFAPSAPAQSGVQRLLPFPWGKDHASGGSLCIKGDKKCSLSAEPTHPTTIQKYLSKENSLYIYSHYVYGKALFLEGGVGHTQQGLGNIQDVGD